MALDAVAGLVFLVCAQIAPIERTGDIALHYNGVVRDYKAALRMAGESRVEARSAGVVFRQRLAELVAQAEDIGPEKLTSRDLIALSEASERLSQSEEALKYARRGALIGDDCDTAVTLLRCLCKLNLTAEAAALAQSSLDRFENLETAYLFPNFMALHLRAQGRYDEALDQMFTTINLVADNVATGPFYPAHLERCFDDAIALAGRARNDVELAPRFGTCRSRLHAQSLVLKAHLSMRRGTDFRVQDDLTAFGLVCRAIMALEERCNPRAAEAIAAEWIDGLVPFAGNCPTAIIESTKCAKQVSRSASPWFDGNVVLDKLKDLDARMRGSGSVHRDSDRTYSEVCSQLAR